jgi:hypothetical protein
MVFVSAKLSICCAVLVTCVLRSCSVEKSFVVDVITKLYIATDSNPVDAHTYELCSDLLDVVGGWLSALLCVAAVVPCDTHCIVCFELESRHSHLTSAALLCCAVLCCALSAGCGCVVHLRSA